MSPAHAGRTILCCCGLVTPKAQSKESCPGLTTSKLLHLHPIPGKDLQRELLAFIRYGLCRVSSKQLQFAADLECLSVFVTLQGHGDCACPEGCPWLRTTSLGPIPVWGAGEEEQCHHHGSGKRRKPSLSLLSIRQKTPVLSLGKLTLKASNFMAKGFPSACGDSGHVRAVTAGDGGGESKVPLPPTFPSPSKINRPGK